MQLTIRHELLTRIDKDLASVDTQHNECRRELVERKVARIEDLLSTIGNAHRASLQACGTSQSEIQDSNLIRSATLFAQYLGRIPYSTAPLPSFTYNAFLPGSQVLRWRYTTDGAYLGRGVYVDDIRVAAPGGTLLDGEAHPESLVAEGWSPRSR